MAPRLLIVDDEPSLRSAVRTYLEAVGYDIDTAGDLPGATELISTRRYDGVIADLRLSGASGTEGLQILELAHRVLPKAALVLLTAYATPEIDHRATAAGAGALLHKPVALREIASAMRGLLSERA